MLYYCARIQFSRNSWFALLITIRSIFLLLSFRRQTGPIFVTRDWDFVKLIKITLCIHIGMSLSPSLALARCGCFLFSSAFWGETNDDDFNEQRRAKECERNFIDYVNCDGFVHQFFSLASSLFLSSYGLAWLGLAYGSGFFTLFHRFRSFQRMGTERHSIANWSTRFTFDFH